MGLLMKSESQPGLNMADPAFNAMYSGANVQPRSVVGGDFFGDDVVTGTETPTATTPTPNETTDIAQMYLEWAASNPNATQEQAFAAGADIALGNNQPIGLGMVDDFSQMPGLPGDDFFGDGQVDEISEVDTFGPEGQINKSGWRDTVIDVSDVQPGSGGGPEG
tara:strand:+ start:163 stop:654 length:492 start_codon:yes stop_codon:yes gene_type:complete